MPAILHGTLERPAWLKKGAFNAVLKVALREVAEYWAMKVLKKHFTPAGAREYGYRERSHKYLTRKRRKFGHADPLVLQGRLKRELLRRSGFRISGTSKSVTITLRTGGQLRSKDAGQELTTVSVRDRVDLTQRLADELGKRLDAYSPT